VNIFINFFRRLIYSLPNILNIRAALPESYNRPINALYGYHCEFDAISLLHKFADTESQPSPEVVTNFLGVKTDANVMPSILTPLLGTKEAFPAPGNWHADIAEWAAALKSVNEASGTYRIIELGCGWGCWLNNTGVAAKSRGLKVELMGIEGDPYHLKSAERTLALNGFNKEEYRLFHGVAAPKEGHALFPRLAQDGETWGAEPIFYPDEHTREKMVKQGTHFELPCIPLNKISNGHPVDLLHIDIQGAELSFVQENFADIQSAVRRILIGTHSRFLEGALIDFFLNHGWLQEMDRPVIIELRGGKPVTLIDGVISFRNPSVK
jgi:FkbM family methyltransferase